MRSWLTALRIARREARRAKGRSALVVVLLGLPVLALTFAAVSYDSSRLSTGQELDRTIGAADAMLRWESGGPVAQQPDGQRAIPLDSSGGEERTRPVTEAELRTVLPPSSRVVPVRRGELELRTATGIGRLTAEAADLTDPIHAGRLVLRDGRAPAADREMALTRRATGRLGVSVGGTVRAADGSASWTVVGIVEYPERFREAVVLRPGALPVEPDRWLVAAPAPVSWEQVRALNQHGMVVRSRAVLHDPPPPDQLHEAYQGWSLEDDDGSPLTAEGLLAMPMMLEVGLLAGAAFAVGARRRSRDLALVAVSGGTPAHQRRIVIADGLVLGLAGAAAGIGLGILAVAAGMPLLEEHVYGRRAGGLRLWPPALAGVGGLAVVTGLLAALVPAAVAARQPVVTGLASRRGVTRSRKRWLVLGLALLGLGAGMAGLGAWQATSALVAAGLVAGQLGLVLCTPALIGLVAQTGRLVPLAPRIALRDTARNRAAAAPALSAVIAAVAGPLTVGIYAVSEDHRIDADYVTGAAIGSVSVRYDLVEPGFRRSLADLHGRVVTALPGLLPVERLAEVRVPGCSPGVVTGAVCEVRAVVPEQNACPWLSLGRELTAAEQRAAARDERCRDKGNGVGQQGGFGSFTVVDDGAALPGLTGVSGDELASAVAVLQADGVVVTDRWAVVDGRATVQSTTYPAESDEPLPPERATVPAYALAERQAGPTVFLSPAVAQRLGLATHLAGVVARPDAGVTVAQEDAANAALRAIDPNLAVTVWRDRGGVSPDLLTLLAVISGVVTLTAAAVATGLAAADRRPDLATLAAVGASPRVRRLLSLSQSGVIAGLGALLGAAAGLAGGFGVLSTLNQRYADSWPTPTRYPLEVPWTALAILLLAVPVVAMLGAGLLTRSRLPIERRW